MSYKRLKCSRTARRGTLRVRYIGVENVAFMQPDIVLPDSREDYVRDPALAGASLPRQKV